MLALRPQRAATWAAWTRAPSRQFLETSAHRLGLGLASARQVYNPEETGKGISTLNPYPET